MNQLCEDDEGLARWRVGWRQPQRRDVLEGVAPVGAQRERAVCVPARLRRGEYKFQGKQWLLKLQDPEFRQVVLDIMDEEIVKKFELEGKNFGVSEDE